MMAATGWVVHRCSLCSLLSCMCEIRMEITLKQTNKQQLKAAAGLAQLPSTACRPKVVDGWNRRTWSLIAIAKPRICWQGHLSTCHWQRKKGLCLPSVFQITCMWLTGLNPEPCWPGALYHAGKGAEPSEPFTCVGIAPGEPWRVRVIRCSCNLFAEVRCFNHTWFRLLSVSTLISLVSHFPLGWLVLEWPWELRGSS